MPVSCCIVQVISAKMFLTQTVEVVDIADHDVVVNTTCKLEVAGVPMAQARPRRGRNGSFYNPKNKDMACFKAEIGDRVDGLVFNADQPVAVDMKFFMRRPNDHFKSKNRSNSLKMNLPFAHTAKPDVDDLIKFMLDALNKIVYEDEKQVVKLTACKLSASEGKCEGRTVVEVTKFQVQR